MTTIVTRMLATGLLTATLGVSIAVVLASEVSAARKVPGNNGTMQLVEQGDAEMTRSNDPKVCTFRFEAFGLDANQTGTVTIVKQAPSRPKGEEVLKVALTTDANGDGATAYINGQDASLRLANGHYKAELDNKFGSKQDIKAKSKVFKVTCEAAPTAPQTVEQPKPVNSNTPEVLGSSTAVTPQAAPAEAKAGELAATGVSVSAVVTSLIGFALGGAALLTARLTRWNFDA